MTSMIDRRARLRRAVVFGSVLGLAVRCGAQATNADATLPDAPAPQTQSQDAATLRNAPRNVLHDQEAIWTSPGHLYPSHVAGPMILVLGTALLIATDHQVMASKVPIDASLNNHAVTASEALTGGFVAAPVILYAMGHLHHDDHATETGVLGGEAILDSLAVNEVLKFASLRERPAVDDAKGKFFQTSAGLDSSFPSNHSTIAWSSAAVLATEYNGPLTKILAYGLATGVSTTRVLGRQHFPSDVVVGGAFGWMIGRYVVHRHHRDD